MNAHTSHAPWPECCLAILNYNGRNHLEEFLPSLKKTNYPCFRIVVIDNASTDDSVVWLNQHYPEIEVVKLPRNYGYAGGYNQGLKAIQTEFLVLINSDVAVDPQWLKPLIEDFLVQPDVAAIQPKILNHRKREYFEYAGAAGGFIDRYGYPFCRGRLFETLEKDSGQYDEACEVFWVSGACMAIRKSAFLQAGGFDDSFFAHMEEIDLCWRLHLLGYRLTYQPESTVYHLGGGTLNYGSARKVFLNFRNSLLMMAKNLPVSEVYVKVLTRLILDGITGIRFLTQGNFSGCWAIVQAHFAFYARIGQVLKHRKSWNLKPMLSISGVWKGSIVWSYFGRKKTRFSKLEIKIK